jgi:PadR family transcriptional regulator PadR
MCRNAGPFCRGRGHHMERFLEVSLLQLLQERSGYGYGLIEELESFGFPQDELQAGTLYRTLRSLEKQELVTSAWEEGGPGPRRRVYSITEAGTARLEQWVELLAHRKERIEKLLERHEALQQGESIRKGT